jgi:hypothetical protein
MLTRVRVSYSISILTTTIISVYASEAPDRFRGLAFRSLIEQKSSTEVTWIKSGLLRLFDHGTSLTGSAPSNPWRYLSMGGWKQDYAVELENNRVVC